MGVIGDSYIYLHNMYSAQEITRMSRYILLGSAWLTIFVTITVADKDGLGFDEEDVMEFCRKGRTFSQGDNGLSSILRNNGPTRMGSGLAAAGPDSAAESKTAIVDKVLLGCAAERGRSIAENDLDPEFERLSNAIEDALVEQETNEDFEKLATQFKNDPRVNYRLFWQSAVRASHRRKEFQRQQVPNAAEYMPEMFIPLGTKENRDLLEATDRDRCYLVDENAGLENGDENMLFYFRENIDLNSHHMYWHLVHGMLNGRDCTLDDKVGSKCHEERRGELFHYMHRALLAMYHTARLSTCLPEIEEFEMTIGGVVDQGYYPLVHIKPDGNNAAAWGGRPKYMELPEAVLYHFTRDGVCNKINIPLEPSLKHWQNVRQAISDGFYKAKDNSTNPVNYDILGNMMEGTDRSPDLNYYGRTHNFGHIFLQHAVPDLRYPGVMGDTGTAMRDPVFYRWHYHINNQVDNYLRSLPPHEVTEGEFPLQWDGIEVEKVELQEVDGYSKVNQLNTFFRKQQLRVSLPDTNSTEEKRVCYKVLEHRDFEYKIRVNNKGKEAVNGTVRIFIAATLAPDGKSKMSLLQQRKYIFPLDIYNVNIPPGKSRLAARSSVDSTVTTARALGGGLNGKSVFACEEHRCGCGLPHNLLIPRGKERSGMGFQVVAIITDGSKYKWTHSEEDDKVAKCKLAPVMCSLPRFGGRKYPDEDLPMGYPFDRLPFRVPKGAELYGQRHVGTMKEYVEAVGNMGLAKVRITHHNLYVKNQDWKNPEQCVPANTKQVNSLCRKAKKTL